jgi:primase-polymerase (primpol)-like protein
MTTTRPRAQKAPPPQGALDVQRWEIPQELRNHQAWACWRYENEHDRWSKPPYNPTSGARAEASNAETWSSFDESFRAYQDHQSPSGGGRPYDGVSFALDLRWGIVGVDLDHTSEHRAEANQIVHLLDSYSERSPSGDGFRVFVRGTLPEGRRRRDWVEMYVQRRFLTVTGHRLERTPAAIVRSRNLYTVWDRWLNRG